MPRFDGTGPLGRGPLTGRGFGNCKGRAMWCDRGFGRGGRGPMPGRFWTPREVELTKEDEKKILESELKEMKADKEAIEKRLKELQKE